MGRRSAIILSAWLFLLLSAGCVRRDGAGRPCLEPFSRAASNQGRATLLGPVNLSQRGEVCFELPSGNDSPQTVIFFFKHRVAPRWVEWGALPRDAVIKLEALDDGGRPITKARATLSHWGQNLWGPGHDEYYLSDCGDVRTREELCCDATEREKRRAHKAAQGGTPVGDGVRAWGFWIPPAGGGARRIRISIIKPDPRCADWDVTAAIAPFECACTSWDCNP